MIRCRVARRRIDERLERELALEHGLELDEHLARCAPCAAHERRARGLQELLEGAGDPPPTAPDVAGAARAVFAALERGQTRARPARRAALVLGTAAAAVLGALLLVLRPRTQEVARADLAPLAAAPEPAWSAERVEAEVRALLLASFASGGLDEERARERYFEGTREAARAGWPVRRFVEGLIEDSEASVALCAVRCLAVLGEPANAPVFERALARAELSDAALDALGALAGLGAEGEPAVAALERALREPALASRALQQLCRVGGARAAECIARAAARASEGTRPSRETLLDALTTTGPAAVASLLELAGGESNRSDSAAILQRLTLVEGGGAELVGILARGRLSGELAYRALSVLQPSEAIPWLEERCGSYRERTLAFETLAHYAGLAPLLAAVRLAESGRVSHADVLGLLGDLFERDGERAAELSRTFTRHLPARFAPTWAALLIDGEHACAAAALVPLIFGGVLPEDEARWAALAVGELGTRADGELLAAALAPHLGADRRRTAACLISVHALLGSDGVAPLLERAAPSSQRRVLAALDGSGRGGEAVLVHRVARALEGVLAELSATDADKKAVL